MATKTKQAEAAANTTQRVYEVAKELGMSSGDLVTRVGELNLGWTVKSHLNQLTADQVSALKDALDGKKAAPKKAAPKKAAPKKAAPKKAAPKKAAPKKAPPKAGPAPKKAAPKKEPPKDTGAYQRVYAGDPKSAAREQEKAQTRASAGNSSDAPAGIGATVREHPLAAVGVAIGAGYLVGRLVRWVITR